MVKFSPQQQAFLDWYSNSQGSCVLEARAGTGKSFTLKAAAISNPKVRVAIIAYNSTIAAEMKEKVKDYSHIHAGTVHSFGLSAYRKVHKYAKVDKFKVLNIIDNLVPSDFFWKQTINKLVSMAKQHALGIIGKIEDDHEWWALADHYDIFRQAEEKGKAMPTEEIIMYAKQAIVASTKQFDIIDFDDMHYMPLFYSMPFWTYDVVMVDEAQDTNQVRRMAANAMLKKGGRLIAVGDRFQAIYGFTGADSDSLDKIAADFSAVRFPLTVTYRCPKAVIKYAQQWVPDIEALPNAEEGKISDSTMEEFLKLGSQLNGNAAVLCRVTKPLVALAFSCIRNRIPCKIEGRKDVGEGLKQLANKWKSIKSLDKLRDKLDTYFDKEKTKLLAKKREAQVAALEDKVETLKVIIDQCELEGKSQVADVHAYIDSLFAEDVYKMGILVLSTIHKSKGREWERVYWLDKDGTCPNKWARQQWQKDQEINLMYVAATRAMKELIHLEPEIKKE